MQAAWYAGILIYIYLQKAGAMLRGFGFLMLAFLFFIIWLVSWLIFHVAGGLIHILLVIGVIALIIHFVSGRSSTGA
jgi:hypothetical protein